MSDQHHFVIVGAGLAGAKAAEALRAEGYPGTITMIGEEPYRPYERPPLSKGYLQGKDDQEKVFVHPHGWYEEHRVDLRLATAVTAIDRAAHEVTLADGTTIHYDKLLIATGASPRRLEVPGADLDGVEYLRRIDDSDRIRQRFGSGGHAVIIGAGWIGLEAAAAARVAGLDVTVLEMADLPLQKVLGDEVAQIFADLHAQHGVDLRFGATVEQITGDDGRVTGVRLADGTHVPADIVLVGVGIAPNVDLAERCGLEVDNGIVVDEHLRTSDPDILAAGDVANAYHPVLAKHVRVEHWANALNQPAVAAKTMVGENASYDRPPYFFTDQYDLGMEYTGHVEPGEYDQVVFRGDPSSGEFIAFWLKAARVLAGMNVNVWDVTDDIKTLVQSQRTIDPSALADPERPLRSLLD